MLATVYAIIESALELDRTLSDEDRDAILSVCRRPRSAPKAGAAPAPKLMTIRQVCEAFHVSRTTVWRMAKTGKLSPIMFGGSPRFRQSDIERIVAPEGG